MKIGNGLVLSILFLIGLFMNSSAEAQTAPGHRGGFPGGRMFEALQLTDAQRTSIERLFATDRENLRPLHQRLLEQRQLLSDATEKQPFDESLVRFQAQELSKLQAELMVARAALMSQVLSVLTSEQRAKLHELREQRKARFQEWREQRRGNPAQQQG